MSALSDAVISACLKMAVDLEISKRRPPGPARRYQEKPVARWCEAPAGHAWLYVDGADRRLWLDASEATHDEAWIWLLHELEHVVFWHDQRGPDVYEMLMMPWSIAVLRYHGIPANTYWSAPYTSTTTTDLRHRGINNAEVGDWRHPMRSTWYKRCRALNVALGVITNDYAPTWKYPDWQAIGFCPSELEDIS